MEETQGAKSTPAGRGGRRGGKGHAVRARAAEDEEGGFRHKVLSFLVQCVQNDEDDVREEDENMSDGAANGVGGACPLQGFSNSAIEWSLPERLRALNGSTPALRVWTTLLVVEALASLDDHYVVTGDQVGQDETTLLDHSLRWVGRQADKCPALADLISGLRDEAWAVTSEWALRHRRLAAASRAVYRSSGWLQFRNDIQLHGGKLLSAVRHSHETAALLLAPPLEELQRWQRALIVLTALQGALAIEVRLSIRIKTPDRAYL